MTKGFLYFISFFMTVPGPLAASELTMQAPVSGQARGSAGLEFDVASIRQNKTDDFPEFNFPIGPGDVFRPTGGVFSAKGLPLISYIAFAYKLNPGPLEAMQHQLPKWVTDEKYDIQAKTEKQNVTKDEMRTMMQALLAERFKLVMRHETQEVAVFDLVPARAGKTGPQLLPHPADSPCSTNPSDQWAADAGPPAAPSVFPATCGGILFMPPVAPNGVGVGGRNVTLAMVIAGMANWGELGRPIVDRTGLTGKYDFAFEWMRQPQDASAANDPGGPSFLTAVTEQLGLKLVATKEPVVTLLIEHVERPTGN